MKEIFYSKMAHQTRVGGGEINKSAPMLQSKWHWKTTDDNP